MTMPEQKKAVVPRLRFPEFRDAGPWEVKRLGEIVEIIKERAGDKKCTLLSVTAGIGLVSQVEKFGREIAGKQRRNYFILRKNDFAYNKSATKDYPEGYIGLYEGDEIAAVPNSIFVCFRPAQEKVVPRYLRFLFEINVHGRWMRRFITVGARAHGSLNIDNHNLLHIPIPLPATAVSIPEQQKIADCLSSLDELIELEAKKLEALQAHKKGLMQQLFPREGETTPRLRFPEFRDAGPWEVKKIGDLFSITRGKVLPMNLISDSPSLEKPYPVYSSQTKHNGLAGYYSEYLFENAITWTTDGANAGDVNYRKGKFYCTNVCGVLLSDEGYANTFVAELLNTVTRKHVSYVGNPKLMNGVMAQIEIPIPHLSEQQKIADCLSSLDELIELQAKQLEALQAHKKGLMQQLFPQEIDL
jgi:type I restriction enzyme S subunit